MFTIKENNIYELEIKKSKFISLIYKITNIDEVKTILNDVKQKYKNANHYCYAYIINNQEKCSDDGEPSGTAGLPILNSLRKENVSNILCIVVRYFGGILLGSGGLIRSYAKACHEVIKKSSLIEIKEEILLSYQFDYTNIDIIDYLLKEASIISKKYDDIITYEFLISLENFNTIKKKLDNLGTIKEMFN